MSIIQILKESLYDEKFVEGSYGSQDRNIEMYVDPSPDEIDRICRDRDGLGGCRIGMDQLDKIYVWSDSFGHGEAEYEFKKKFGYKKFIYTKGENIMYISSGLTEDDWKFIPPKSIKRLLLYFPQIKYFKTETDHKLLYEVK